MNLGPTTEPRTFHIMTMRGDHKLIDTIYAAKSLKEAVARVVTVDTNVVPFMRPHIVDLLMDMLKQSGKIIFNSVQAVIIVY